MYIGAIIFSGLFCENLLNAQTPVPEMPVKKPTYQTAIGFRAGGTSGLTIKQFTSDNMAIEGILGIWPFSMSATGLIEFYTPTEVEGLNWYYGAGGHIAFETGRIYYANDVNRYVYREGDLGLGADGILGIEYKILPIPFAISLDLKPFFEINTNGRAFLSLHPELGVKFAF